jgi:glycosyltransferase involved in cell wall biosynthesis
MENLAGQEQAARWEGRVLFVSPHAQYFIGDQMTSIEKSVRGLSVMIPSPWGSSFVSRLPFFSNRFASLRRARASQLEIPGNRLLLAKYLDFPGKVGRGLTYTLAARSCQHRIQRSKVDFDVIHSHFLRICGFIGSALKSNSGKPLVVTAYGGDAYSLPFADSFNKNLAISIIKSADHLIAVSKPIAQTLYDLGAARGEVSVIPSGFNSKLFAPWAQDEARTRLGLPAEREVLLTVANLVPQKGHTYLLEAFRQLAESRKDLVLVLVGGGELEGPLRHKAGELGLSGRVIFAGPRPHAEIATWINACDVFVLPSISEGSPTVIPEVMACGKPIIATRVGGIPDLVREGEEGYLASPTDVAELAAAVNRALDQKWSVEMIRAHALTYSWDALSAQILRIYSKVT